MVTIRKDSLASGHYYHIYSRSIAGYVVFNDDSEYSRMLQLLDLYRFKDFSYRYSKFLELDQSTQLAIINEIKKINDSLVDIVAYCLMPTHIHFLLKQVSDNGITQFIGKILNSYSKSFNNRHKRNGPLWSGRFKNVLIGTDEQLLHLTRYIHLNPTSAGLIANPDDWTYSSYNEYVEVSTDKDSGICKTNEAVDLGPKQYKKFVNDHKNYQRELAMIKSLLIDNYTG